jgi:hypothetical protein
MWAVTAKRKPADAPLPSRRRVMQMLAAAIAAAAVGPELVKATEPVRSTWSGKTRWIGHC